MKNIDVQNEVSLYKEVSLYNEVSLYSVVTFKEHGYTGNEVKAIVTSISGDEIITVEDFNDQVWTMNVNNVKVSSIFSGDNVK